MIALLGLVCDSVPCSVHSASSLTEEMIHSHARIHLKPPLVNLKWDLGYRKQWRSVRLQKIRIYEKAIENWKKLQIEIKMAFPQGQTYKYLLLQFNFDRKAFWRTHNRMFQSYKTIFNWRKNWNCDCHSRDKSWRSFRILFHQKGWIRHGLNYEP